MTQDIEERLKHQLPAAADAILSGALDRPALRFRRRGVGLVAVAAAALMIAGGGTYAFRHRQLPVVVATSARSAADAARTAGLGSELYYLANDVMAPTIPATGRVELFERAPETMLESGDLALVAPDSSDGIPTVRRIVGLPGQGVEVRGSFVLVNGAPLNEPYVAVTEATGPPVELYMTLGPDEYLVLPDNRAYGDATVIHADRIVRWAPRDTTALEPYDPSERQDILEDYDECLRTGGVDTFDLATDPASIFDDTARRLTPTNIDSGALCMRRYVRLGIAQDAG